MKKPVTYVILSQSGYYFFIILLCLFLSACNATKYVPEGESLLNENHINVNEEAVEKTELIPYIKQVPNKRIFGSRFHLGLYNLSNINKQKWPHNWLRTIGEEPVIYDPFLTEKSKEQIKSYVTSKGFFDGRVTDTVRTENRKSDVYFNVELRRPYTIRKLTYEIADSNVQKFFYFDSVNCVIERGKPYDVDVLQAERARFERFIRDRGFYGFNSDYITFRIDSSVGNRQVDIRYNIRSFTKIDSINHIVKAPFAIYTIRNIYIYPDYVPRAALEGGEEYFKNQDTTFYGGYYFITSNKKPEVKYDLILQSLFLNAGSVYSITGTEETQMHLQNLKIFRLVNIIYNDSRENESLRGLELKLDCNIQLTLLSQQSYKVELEGTNSAGNLGGALNLVYQNKNLFHGAELFSTKLKGAYSAYKVIENSNVRLKSLQEYGAETSIKLPKFLLPFLRSENFIKKYNPSTTFQVSFNYQNMPFYTRTLADATFGYNWKSGFYKEHFINPLSLNLVNVLSIDKSYEDWIKTSTYQANSYKDVLIIGCNYSYIYNNQKIKNSKDYWFLRINAETAGNTIGLFEKISGGEKTAGLKKTPEGALADSSKAYRVFGQPFAQYVKADIDVRYNYKFNDVSSIVYRGFFGIGIPYGNSRAVPFERQYFGGGANGIRAWQVRSLGPGSYNPNFKLPGDTAKVFLNETGDIKLEINAEYRFKLFLMLEGAVFVDAGNIWTFNKDDARLGSQFRFNHFYKDIAVGTGIGFRFDFKFVIARIDIGMKLRDPLNGSMTLNGNYLSMDSGSKWIFLNGPYKRDDFTVVLGIGYPF